MHAFQQQKYLSFRKTSNISQEQLPAQKIYKKGILKNFAKFTEKHLLCQSLFLNKVAGLIPATLLKKRSWRKSFAVIIGKFFKTPILKNICELLLSISTSVSRVLVISTFFNDKFHRKRCLNGLIIPSTVSISPMLLHKVQKGIEAFF